MALSSFLPAFDITFWNQWRKPSTKQEEVYQSHISKAFLSIQHTALCAQSDFNQLLPWQGLNSSLNSEEASQKDGQEQQQARGLDFSLCFHHKSAVAYVAQRLQV